MTVRLDRFSVMWLAYALAALLLFGFVVAVHFLGQTAETRIADVYRRVEPMSESVYEMKNHAVGMAFNVREFLQTGESAYRERLALETSGFAKDLERFQRLAGPPANLLEGFRRLTNWWQPLQAQGQRLIVLASEQQEAVGQVSARWREMQATLSDQFPARLEQVDAAGADTGRDAGRVRHELAAIEQKLKRQLAEPGGGLGSLSTDAEHVFNHVRVLLQLASTNDERRRAGEIEVRVTELDRLIAALSARDGELQTLRREFHARAEELVALFDREIEPLVNQELAAAEALATRSIRVLRYTSKGLFCVGLLAATTATLMVARRNRQLVTLNRALKDESARYRDANAQRQQLAGRLVSAEEDERARLARDLHDQTVQDLTALGFGLEALRRSLAAGRPAAELVAPLERLAKTADGLTQQVRTIAWELRPLRLDQLAFQEALAELLAAWRERTGLAVEFHYDVPDEQLCPSCQTALYRITQEALSNVARHAGASRVSVVLRWHDPDVVLIVEDDGRGFDPERPPARASAGNGMGLEGIRQRLAAIGGSMAIESSPGEGTTLIIRLPAASSRRVPLTR